MSWDGTERRKGYENMVEDFHKLDTKVEVLIARMEEWMVTTKTYREQLCLKFDKVDGGLSKLTLEIEKKLNDLPCRERYAWYDSITKQVKWLWVIVSGAVLAIMGDWARRR